MNIRLAKEVIQKLSGWGVRDFVICAGARNAPFVKVLGSSTNHHFFFDERAAGFFALGRSKRDGRPVAVVVTSGTAAAELLPSVIEAYYSGTPIVLVTADRPRSYRGSGAPQAIEQVGLFSNYVSGALDIETEEDLQRSEEWPMNAHGPTHLNVCFSEPLMDGEATSWGPR